MISEERCDSLIRIPGEVRYPVTSYLKKPLLHIFAVQAYTDYSTSDFSKPVCADLTLLDSDDDGIVKFPYTDFFDNCPEIHNPDQADGDADKIGDACDNCPGVYNTGQVNADADDLGDACDDCIDPDLDDICKTADNCPDLYNPGQVDADEDGIGDACDSCMDMDWDGTCDPADNCPDVYNPGQRDTNDDGIGDACEPCDEDQDQDGTCDPADNCPLKPNPGQADSDGDGVGDECDGCPQDPIKTGPGFCGCGIEDNDLDNDEIPECFDNCPEDPNKSSPGICGCGTMDMDADADGLPDCIDGCPLDPAKTDPGVCGCGVSDEDSDGDASPDCVLDCPSVPGMASPGDDCAPPPEPPTTAATSTTTTVPGGSGSSGGSYGGSSPNDKPGCKTDSDCSYGQVCDTFRGLCVECLVNAHCSDGLYCNGSEYCLFNTCFNSSPPCGDDEICDEDENQCSSSSPSPECSKDSDCDDGLFCNGNETCVEGVCALNAEPCTSDEICMEEESQCWGSRQLNTYLLRNTLHRPVYRRFRCPWLVLKLNYDETYKLPEGSITLYAPFRGARGVRIDSSRAPFAFRDFLLIPICLDADATVGEWRIEINVDVHAPVNPYTETVSTTFEIK